LSTKAKGLTREEIIAISKISNGGGLSTMLEELEQCDFIRKYQSFGKKEQLSLYQLTDFYLLFYYNFLKNNMMQFCAKSVLCFKKKAKRAKLFILL
jgi:hypothetical protein